MKINLTQLMRGVEEKTPFEFEYNVSDEELSLMGAIESETFVVNGSIIPVDDDYLLELYFDGLMSFDCSRCTDKVDLRIQECVQRVIKTKDHYSPVDEEYGIVKLEGYFLDLEPLFLEELVIALPSTVLCKDDCDGLCHTCGINLNRESCKCQEDKIDPRMEALKKFSIK